MVIFSNRIGCAMLAAWLSLAVGRTATAQLSASDFLFPKTQAAEAFAGRSSVVEVTFKIYFPVGEQRYLPVNSEIAAALSMPPNVSAPSGMRVIVLSTVCKPEELVIVDATRIFIAKGARIESRIEITPDSSLTDGSRQITLDYDLLDLIFAKIGGPVPGKAQVLLNVQLWPSPAAKAEALRVKREKRRQQQALAEQQRQAEEAAREAKARFEAQAAAQARAARRAERMRQALPYLFATVLAAFLIFLNRRWLFPDVTVALGRGQHVQKSLPPLERDDGVTANAGTILQTIWAHGWLGARKRIKVETFVPEDTVPGAGRAPLDVLVSVGSSVRPGRYLAKTRHQAVRIEVTERPAGV